MTGRARRRGAIPVVGSSLKGSSAAGPSEGRAGSDGIDSGLAQDGAKPGEVRRRRALSKEPQVRLRTEFPGDRAPGRSPGSRPPLSLLQDGAVVSVYGHIDVPHAAIV